MKTLEDEYKELYAKKAEIDQRLKDIKQQLINQFESDPHKNFKLLTVYHIPSKKSVSWKNVAEELNPPESLVLKYSKIIPETYGVRIKKEGDVTII